LPSIAPR